MSKLIIVVRHGPYLFNPKDGKSFWQEYGKLDVEKFDVKETIDQIQKLLDQNDGYTLKDVCSTTILRARQTAIKLANAIEVSGERPSVIFSEKLDPQIDKWEKLNTIEEYHSIASVKAMYKDGSPSKPLLQEEGCNLLKNVKDKLKEIKDGDAIIIVSHSPLIEAFKSALNKDWNKTPETLEKGGVKSFLFAH
ncbi:MAG: histidine phosphatase family protein [Candidatus Pacebacteria bacterium]|nr:histidine phosphatase family protein [Candidatus Paceibacterota bacterium]